MKQGISILRSQVLGVVAGTGLRRRVKVAMSEWVSTTIHLANYGE